MKSCWRKVTGLMLSAVVLALSGCAGAAGETPSVSSAPPSVEASAGTSLLASPTIVPTPVPTTAAVLEPTPEPVPTPTPAPSDGRVTIAEGFYYVKLSDEIKERITGMSYPADDTNAKIHYDELRYLRVRYYDFEEQSHDNGELIVNKAIAKEVTKIFYELYKAKYPFTSIRLVDDFGQPGHDTLSMEANNTSGFCYRKVNGSSKYSIHSFGLAIDINPRLNPYVNGDRVSPRNSVEYLDRTLGLPGMIDHDDLCYKLFTQNGWKWGGDWSGDKDYQHFYKDPADYGYSRT